MVESGDWLVPHYQGRPFFDKPALSYWAMAASMWAFGTTAGAARLVPLASAPLVVLATIWLGTLLFDRRTALVGGLVLATTVGFLSFARIAMSDMPLALWTTLAVALGVRAYRPAAPGWTIPVLGVVLGLGFLTKGPIGILVPGLALVLLAWEHRERPLPCRLAPALLGIAGFVVAGLGWYVLVSLRLGMEPLVHFFLRENLERFAGETFDVGRPFWFYLPAYLAGGLPWSVFLPIALVGLLRAPASDERQATRFLGGWSLLVLVALSISRGKIDYYLLPLYPAVSLLLGRYFAVCAWRRLDMAYARAALVLGALAVAAFLAFPPRLPEEWLPEPTVRVVLVATLVAAGLALLAIAARPNPRRVVAVFSVAVGAVFCLIVAFFIPAFAAAQPNRGIAAAVALERLYEPRARLVLCDDPSHAQRDVLFAARHAALEQCALWSAAGSGEPFLMLITPAQADSFRVLPRYQHLARVRYMPASVLTLRGLFSRPKPGELTLCANYWSKNPASERSRKRAYRKAFRGVPRP